MKKLFVLLAVALLSATAMEAQEFQKFKIAFKMNPNVSWLVPQDNQITNEASVVRFGFGVNMDVHFTKNYAVGTGLNIDNSGGELKYLYHEITNDDAHFIIEKTRNYNLKYVEVPITLKLRTNEIGYITYWGQFGIGLGINVSAKADDRDSKVMMFDEEADGGLGSWVGATGVTENEDMNVSDDIKALKTALIIGAGIEYNVSGNSSIVVGLTFNNGFSNVLNKEGVERTESDKPFLSSDSLDGVEKFDLKSISNSFVLNIGLLF